MHYRENYIALENTYIDVNRLLVETRNMGIQDAVSESSKGNEEQVTENGGQDDPCDTGTESIAECILQFSGKQNL